MSTKERPSPDRERRYTVDDYMRLDDDQRYELIDGELLLTPAPNQFHQVILGNIHAVLRAHVRERKLGQVLLAPFDVVLGNFDVVQPDVLFVSSARMKILADGKNAKGAPDLAVEILSKSTRSRDLVRKRALYARSGVTHLWFVDPEPRTLMQFVLDGRDYRETARVTPPGIFTSALFPDLPLDLDEVFS
jgi:Uma2 family endonuclease